MRSALVAGGKETFGALGVFVRGARKVMVGKEIRVEWFEAVGALEVGFGQHRWEMSYNGRVVNYILGLIT